MGAQLPNTKLDITFNLSLATSNPGVNPYSAIGLRGSLSPIAAVAGSDKFRRTVNGGLKYIGAPQMQKYRVEISGSFQAPPAYERLWPGTPVFVSLINEIAFLTGSATPERTPVPGSVRLEGNYTYYRPQLAMQVIEWDIPDFDEWQANIGHKISFEEV